MPSPQWKTKKIDGEKEAREALMNAGMPAAAAAVMAKRGMDPRDVEAFINPVLVNYLPKLSQFPDLKKAGIFLANAIMTNRKIGIWSDYDCDGVTSALVLSEFLEMCGVEPYRVHIPDRMTEGYGPNQPGIERLFGEGVEAMFVLDSGTVAVNVFAPLPEEIRQNITIIDHHLAGDTMPEVHAIVNPNRRDQEPGYGQMCAAGVTFLVCQSALTQLNARKHAWPGKVEPKMSKLLDLVAVGTVADVVPLTGINRAFVRRGLKIMSEKKNVRPALQAILDVARAKKIGAYEIGFVIGPRINAAGRISQAIKAFELFREKDPEKIAAMAKLLDDTNTERKNLEKKATIEVIESLEGCDPEGRDVIVAVADAHVGIVGISAARVKDRYNRPVIVVSEDPETGKLKGSARSMEGFNIGEAIHEAQHRGLIVQGGGHAMAAGLTLLPEQVDRFRDFMTEECLASEFGRVGVVETFDAEIKPRHVNESIHDAFATIEPCGTGNPAPRLFMNGLTAIENPKKRTVFEVIGKDPQKRHLKFDVTSNGEDGCTCIIFGLDVSGQGEYETILRSGRPFALSGKLSRSEYYSRREGKMIVDVEFMVDKVIEAFDPEPEPVREVTRAEEVEP